MYNYAKQHPQIYMSREKEPYYFAFGEETPQFRGPNGMPSPLNKLIVNDFDAYLKLFQDVKNEAIIGEASPLYLYSEKACNNIRNQIPDARLVAILRDPVERAFSSYLHMVRDGYEQPAKFVDALNDEPKRIQEGWGWLFQYTRLSRYYVHVKRYKEIFPEHQFRVYMFSDFQRNPVRTMRDLFEFLSIDSNFSPDVSLQHNITGVPRSRAIHRFLTEPHAIKNLFKPLIPERWIVWTLVKLRGLNLSKPTLDADVRHELIDVFKEDILRLQDLIDRDLSSWLN